MIQNSQNKPVALVGLDIGVDIINKNLADYLPVLIGLMMFSCLLSFVLIYVIVTKIIVKPIHVLESASLNCPVVNLKFSFRTDT